MFVFQKEIILFLHPLKRPDGGIGRRAWLRAMFPFWECKFDSCSGHRESDECRKMDVRKQEKFFNNTFIIGKKTFIIQLPKWRNW